MRYRVLELCFTQTYLSDNPISNLLPELCSTPQPTKTRKTKKNENLGASLGPLRLLLAWLESAQSEPEHLENKCHITARASMHYSVLLPLLDG